MFFCFNLSWIGKTAMVFMATIMLSLTVGGCTSKYGTQTVDVKHYPDCYKPIMDLRQDESDSTQGTVLGALIGGVAGTVIGLRTSGDATGAIIGGVAGAIVGGAAGYLITDEIQRKSREERFASYVQALDKDILNLSLAVAAAKVTSDCYEKEYAKLDKLYNAGQIDKKDMMIRLEEMRSGTNDANTILASFSAEMADNQLVYNDIQKRELARKADKMPPKAIEVLNTRTKQLGNIDSESQKVANILSSRSKIYSNRLDVLSNTAHNKSGLGQMASLDSLDSLTTACVL